MMTEPEYIAYFENLAKKHALIRHDSEADKGAFYVVRDDNRTELEKAIRNKLSLPSLLLDQYFDEGNTAQDNNRLKLLGGFSVICKVEDSGEDCIRAARHEARLIAKSILNRIRRDLRMPNTLLSNRGIFMEPSVPGEMTPVLAGATGWGYSFTWLMPDTVAVNPADWGDL